MEEEPTTFQEVYDLFLAGITDDMFMELTLSETLPIMEELLVSALPNFEFPRKDINDLNLEDKAFKFKLTSEEMMIIRTYMICEWLGYQIANVDLVRQKYSGTDFKFTSQANHIDKLLALHEMYENLGFKLQRLYCRRKLSENDGYVSTFAQIMEKPTW